VRQSKRALPFSRSIIRSMFRVPKPGCVGDCTTTGPPISLQRRISLPSASCTHRLAREGNDWFLYVTRDGEQIQGWVSTMEEEYLVDFEMMTVPNCGDYAISFGTICPRGSLRLAN
jgi:hypothetical protein